MRKIGIRRVEGETWHDCAVRYAEKFGLRYEVAKQFDTCIKSGMGDEQAALAACGEWGLCELLEERVGQRGGNTESERLREALRKIASDTTGSVLDIKTIAFDALVEKPINETPTSEMVLVALDRLDQILRRQQVALENINRIFIGMVQAANENVNKGGH